MLLPVRHRRRDSAIDTAAYGGFISYSHAADGELAPTLQRVWDPRTGASLGPVIDLHHMEANYGASCALSVSLAFASDGALVAGSGPNGPPVSLFSPLLISSNGRALDAQVCAVVARDLTPAEFRAAAPGATCRPVYRCRGKPAGACGRG